MGVWSLALRRAGWPDDRPVWTGSCPCQPFSSAGQGAGFDDERHLWPDFHWLIQERRPPVVFGEQVASKDAEPWVDLVQADLEAMAYAFGAVPFPAAGVGSPNIRDRLYWVANANANGERRGKAWHGQLSRKRSEWLECGSDPGRLDHTNSAGPQGRSRRAEGEGQRLALPGRAGSLANAECGHAAELAGCRPGPGGAQGAGSSGQPEGCSALPNPRPAGPTNGLWGAADWLLCRDGKWRPVEPGTFPLAHGAPARVGRLRAYGNAINAEAATQFIAACRDFIG
ncbi:DNA cytosine methyltransferase [Ectopseudomonas mendocina]|uniref:DNA cytosine methyltransferase n=1 Tax=Ectopseudomonas mendocina TaxID=300 RepID=UPI0021B13830|nr:DNA cytosine methyltransferase [Pseudomonas mendocina]